MIVHVVPQGDLITHETVDCPCGPLVELRQTDDGDRWMYVHHSLDGREIEDLPVPNSWACVTVVG